MTIQSLRISNFRNISSASFPCASFNLFFGDNGSGKTSLLEAIHYLSLGRSFRTATASRLIRANTQQFALVSSILNTHNLTALLGIERDLTGNQRIRMGEQDLTSMTEIAFNLPTRLINSQSHQLLESGPAFKRKFIDWGLFYQGECFLTTWRQYERVLKQRNRVLKDNLTGEWIVWTEKLIQYGLQLSQLRENYLKELTPYLITACESLLGLREIQFKYLPGWPADTNLDAFFLKHRYEEFKAGFSLFGPHRADIEITCAGLPIKHFFSRGQQKLLICAMIISQGMLLKKQAKRALSYLIDDLPAELDRTSRSKVLNLLLAQEAQVFITAIQTTSLEDALSSSHPSSCHMFHVEQGSIRQACPAKREAFVRGS